MSKTITRCELSDAVYREIGLSYSESNQLVSSALEEISLSLEAGETVKLSSFGTFSINNKEERVGRNPKTGKPAPIPSRRVLCFRASHFVKNRINSN